MAQLREQVEFKIKQFGPNAHCGQLVVSEELRQQQIANKPDAQGKRKTRISFETYSPEHYSLWNEMMEYLMERCGYNPLIVCDLLYVLVGEARRGGLQDGSMDGIDIALHGLFKVNTEYETQLKDAKAEKKRARKATKASTDFLQQTEDMA